MWHSVKVFLFLPPILLALDYLWLGIVASGLYKRELGSFLRMSGNGLQPILWAALIVYLAIPLGIVLFVLPRVSAANPIPSALVWGAAYGLVVYAIYEMTNYSLVRDWPLRLALIDICWGAVLNALGSAAAAWLDRWIK
ncbi:MAG: DUF2177 family protein [Acidobacteria bacterium]|nr:DUF2177 family protein [Acidobacteriota bacterium]